MAAELPEPARRLIDEPNLAHVVTLMKDGSPQVTPVWINRDGDTVLVNTAEGRQKMRNLRRDPRVAISILDAVNRQHYTQIRGRVVEMITGEDAYQHINSLSHKYNNGRDYPRREGEQRVKLVIEVDHVAVSGSAPQPATT